MIRLGRPAAYLALPALACLAWAHPAPAPTLRAATTSASSPSAPSPSASMTRAEPTLTLQSTLYAKDFLRRTVSLETGAYGLGIQDHQVVNVDSELEFGSYYPNRLLAGVQGTQVGRMLDLGTGEELAQRYGYQETVGGGQGFASIHFENGELVILSDYATQTFQPFGEGSRFYEAAPPSSSRPIDVHVGHLYLVRIWDLANPAYERFAKLIVTAHRDDEEVSVAWEEILP